MKNISLGILGTGLLLLLLSGLWTTLFPATSSWTPEKSLEWTKVKDRLHTLGFIVGSSPPVVSMHSGPETGDAKVEYEQLKAEHAAFTAEFTSVHDRPIIIAKILKWSGISLAVVGVIGLYVANQSR